MELIRIKNDINGNSRYIVKSLDLVTPEDRAEAPQWGFLPWLINRALERSRKIGGRRYRSMSYPGYIVFQECGEELLRHNIKNILK